MKQIKRYLILGTIAIALLWTTSVAFAQTPTVKSTAVTRQEKGMENLKVKGGKETDRRIASLTNVITRLNETKKLSDSEKQALISQVQAEISSLTSLKIKIDGETDLATLRTQVQLIVQSYRTYVLYMPKIHIIVAADKVISVADQITALTGRLQGRIDEAQAKGEDVVAMTAALTDLQAKVSDAKLQAEAAKTEVTSLTPTGYPGNKTTLQSARTKLKTAAADLRTARQDIQIITQGSRSLKAAEKVGSSSSATRP